MARHPAKAPRSAQHPTAHDVQDTTVLPIDPARRGRPRAARHRAAPRPGPRLGAGIPLGQRRVRRRDLRPNGGIRLRRRRRALLDLHGDRRTLLGVRGDAAQPPRRRPPGSAHPRAQGRNLPALHTAGPAGDGRRGGDLLPRHTLAAARAVPVHGDGGRRGDRRHPHPLRLGPARPDAAVDRVAAGECGVGRVRMGPRVGRIVAQRALRAGQHARDPGLRRGEKGYVGKRPRTWFALTTAGRTVLERHVAALRRVVEESQVAPHWLRRLRIRWEIRLTSGISAPRLHSPARTGQSRTPSRLRNDHHARITSGSTSVP